MSEKSVRRAEGAAQLDDQSAERAVEQDLGQEQVSDRNEDGYVDAVADEGDVVAVRDPDSDDARADTPAELVDVDGSTVPEDTDTADERDELMPGDMTPEPVGALWSSQTAGDLRQRWQTLQLRFVDDPRGVVTEAQSLVGEAVDSLTTSLTDQQRELDGWASGGDGDTEQLRVALQRYREFFDRMLGPV
jgi:hypothetical protein